MTCPSDGGKGKVILELIITIAIEVFKWLRERSKKS